jgi:hypothetical protein
MFSNPLMKECTTMKASTTPKAKATPKPPQAKRPKAKTAKAPEATPAPDPLAGVTIRAEVLTYKPDYHRPRIHIKTPTGHYYKLVPGVRTATKAEALTAAQQYREAILASGELPPKGERQPKATPPRPDRFGWRDGDLTVTDPQA